MITLSAIAAFCLIGLIITALIMFGTLMWVIADVIFESVWPLIGIFFFVCLLFAIFGNPFMSI